MNHIFMMAFLSLITSSSQAFSHERLTIYFSPNPPVICQEGPKLGCVAGRLFTQALELEGLDYRMVELPWIRAEKEMQKHPNSLFLATARNDTNESRYSWFFPIYKDENWLFSLKRISKKQLKGLDKVGVRLGSPFDVEFSPHGFKLFKLADWSAGAKMLTTGRIDAINATPAVLRHNILSKPELKGAKGFHLKLGTLTWYAIRPTKSSDTPAIIRLRRGLATIKESQEFKQLLESEHIQ